MRQEIKVFCLSAAVENEVCPRITFTIKPGRGPGGVWRFAFLLNKHQNFLLALCAESNPRESFFGFSLDNQCFSLVDASKISPPLDIRMYTSQRGIRTQQTHNYNSPTKSTSSQTNIKQHTVNTAKNKTSTPRDLDKHKENYWRKANSYQLLLPYMNGSQLTL